MPTSQGRIRKMVRYIQNLLGLHACVKGKPAEAKESDEKLLNIFNELTVGISEVFEDKPRDFDEYLRCDKVSCKISVLSEQIGQVRILYSLWKNGYDLNPKELIAKLQSLNLLVDCIRDDVFYAYLQLPPEQKLQLLKKNKQVSAIFAVLGTLENEVSDMMKTLFPNEELMKAIKPLLKPNFNRVMYRRQAKNFYCYDSPAYQTVQFSCKKVTCKKPKLVDAWTEPIGQGDWDYYDDLLGNTNSFKLPVKDLEPVHRCHHSENSARTENAACQVSLADENEIYEDFLIMENSLTLTELKNQDRVSIDQLSIVASDVNEIPKNRNMYPPQQDSFTCSQECLKSSFEPQQGPSFWKMAADLIADQPVRS